MNKLPLRMEVAAAAACSNPPDLRTHVASGRQIARQTAPRHQPCKEIFGHIVEGNDDVDKDGCSGFSHPSKDGSLHPQR